MSRTAKTVVFTNGVFDLFHAGHVALLNQARTYGDVLIVGILDDRTTSRRKGQDRPVWPAVHRERVVASHPCVTTTIVYGGSVATLLRAIRPDVLVRGEDQRMEGAEYADKVVRIARTPGISTTQLIQTASERCFETCHDYSCARMGSCTGAGKWEDEKNARRS